MIYHVRYVIPHHILQVQQVPPQTIATTAPPQVPPRQVLLLAPVPAKQKVLLLAPTKPLQVVVV